MSSKNGFVLVHEAVFLCRKLVSALIITHFSLSTKVQHGVLCIFYNSLENETPSPFSEGYCVVHVPKVIVKEKEDVVCLFI